MVTSSLKDPVLGSYDKDDKEFIMVPTPDSKNTTSVIIRDPPLSLPNTSIVIGVAESVVNVSSKAEITTERVGIVGLTWLDGINTVEGGDGPTSCWGELGLIGLFGESGLDGRTGPGPCTGLLGVMGATGLMGFKGLIGDTGPTSCWGCWGELGFTGLLGDSGP